MLKKNRRYICSCDLLPDLPYPKVKCSLTAQKILADFYGNKDRWYVDIYLLMDAKNLTFTTFWILMIYSRFNNCINSPLKLIRKAIKTFIATKESFFLQFDRRFESFSSKHWVRFLPLTFESLKLRLTISTFKFFSKK